jgi:signal peptidase I
MSIESTLEQTRPEYPSWRRRILAFLFALVSVGAGHAVLGHTSRGLRWFTSLVVAMGLLILAVVFGWPSLAWFFVAVVVVIRFAAIFDTLRLRNPQSGFGGYTAILLALLLTGLGELAASATTAFVRAERYQTDSMYPTIEAGDHLIMSRVYRTVGRGDLISFDYPADPTKRYLKRIIGVGGDTVQILGGQVILNGKPIERVSSPQACVVYQVQCTIWRETIDGKTYQIAMLANDEFLGQNISRDFGPVVIPADMVFVLGDNRDNSADSRHWGNVPMDLIRAKTRFVYWSSNQSGIRWDRLNQILD